MPQPPPNAQPGVKPCIQPRHGLPQAVPVRLSAVPDSAPPYDKDRMTMSAAHAGQASPGAGVPADRAPASGSPAANGTASPDSTGAADRTGAADGTAAVGSAGAADSTDPVGSAGAAEGAAAVGSAGAADAWPGQFAQVLAETLAGSRTQGQIVPWTSDQARRRIRQLGPMLAAGTVPRVRRVVTTFPAAGVVEMTVVVGFGPKVRALAVRLERDGPRRLHPGHHVAAAPRWVCTAIEAA
jgi:hypothetical protein